VVLPVRIELTTSPLTRECSTRLYARTPPLERIVLDVRMFMGGNAAVHHKHIGASVSIIPRRRSVV
jgi:hypothetical protein